MSDTPFGYEEASASQIEKIREEEQIAQFQQAAAAADAEPAADDETLYWVTHDTVEADYVPSDGGFSSQWHLNNRSYPGMDLNVTKVWDDYRGDGVKVGVLDDGFDYLHKDLSANYDRSLDYDFYANDSDAYIRTSSKHGTAVAGVIGADDNGTGAVGVAPDATLAGYQINFSAGISSTTFANAFTMAAQNVDVLSNSWSFTGMFSDNKLTTMSSMFTALEGLAKNGRGGLGTVTVFSAGNSQGSGDNVNYHGVQNSPYTIAVGATDASGKYTSFSTPGAAVLVSAPGKSIYTTDNSGSAGYSTGDYTSVSGTSFSAPAVSGVVALMLDANAKLGYRDVQEILALSAKNSDTTHSGWQSNSAGTWNNGGMHFSHNYGFGLVDALAAVRLAETWNKTQTFANMDQATYTATPNVVVPDKTTITSSINVTKDIEIDQVLVTVNLPHTNVGHLQLILVSPDGTESVLMNYAGATSSNVAGSEKDFSSFQFSTVAHWGESSVGTWTLKAYDRITGTTGTLKSWSLTFMGDDATADELYVFTNEYAKAAGSTMLSDSNGGTDTINAAAVTGDSIIDLSGATAGRLAGRSFTVNAGSTIEKAYTGDGNDTIRDNSASNYISAGRGNDSVHGGAGTDTFDGGQGTDTMFFAQALSNFSVKVVSAAELVISYATTGVDKLLNFEWFSFNNVKYTFQQMLDYAGGVLSPPSPEPTPSPEPSPSPTPAPTPPPTDEGAPADPIGLSFKVLKTNGTTATLTTTSDTISNDTYSSSELSIGSSSADTALIINREADRLVVAGNAATTRVKEVTITTGVTTDYEISDITTVRVNAQKAAGGVDMTISDLQNSYIYTANGSDSFTVNVDNRDGSTSSTYNTLRATLYGGDDQMTVTGENASFRSLIDLGAGNDAYRSSVTGAETVYGRDGDDRIETGAGADRLYGHAGNDVISAGSGNDYVYGDIGNDTIQGGDGKDYLRGDSGNDTMSGDAGNDTLLGSYGNDVLDGGAGNDSIDGSYGNDTLYTSDGTDSLRGGADADTFVLRDVTGTNRITDFSVTQGDRLDISDVLTGFDAGDAITDFLQLQYNATLRVTEVKVNASGSATGTFETYAQLSGNHSALDLEQLHQGGLIITS